MKLISLASVLASVSVLFVDPVLSEIKATTVFETIPEGKDGSCSGRDLDTMVHEAITLNDKAIGALDSINDPNGFSLREKGHTAQMAIAMWGVQPRRTLLGFSSDGIYFNGDDLTLLNKVKSNYQKVNDKLKATENTDGGKLTCGDKDWLFRKTWKDMGSRFQNPEGTVGRGGAFVSQRWSEKDEGGYILKPGKIIVLQAIEPGVNRIENGVCGPTEVAFTIAKDKYIAICDQAFKKTKTLADLLGEQDQFPQGLDVTHLNTTGTDLHHEMFHYIDEEIVDQTDGIGQAYFWRNCLTLAQRALNSKDKPEEKKTVLNADTYRLFATAVFFDRIKWTIEGKKP